jgi:hypothetical protein
LHLIKTEMSGRVAQGIEQLPSKQSVARSNRAAITKRQRQSRCLFFIKILLYTLRNPIVNWHP